MDLRIPQHRVLACAAVGTLVMADEPSKVGSLSSNADIDSTRTMAVHTEKDETDLEGIRSLATSSRAEFLEKAEVFTGKVLSDNPHLNGDEVI
ncbi:hypothetical protein PR202_ga06957 [Eleusine coracana subsp. coracana]|uniref:Uncharacterized protein n=1 Tax=Eleusine coracana subsp. coracana TaxID=191504 RepID=A0AAV5BX94_ELECO|nr:hypothetical protein PR202_ga06957 [Eleusine coracana subsp. coracana]